MACEPIGPTGGWSRSGAAAEASPESGPPSTRTPVGDRIPCSVSMVWRYPSTEWTSSELRRRAAHTTTAATTTTTTATTTRIIAPIQQDGAGK